MTPFPQTISELFERRAEATPDEPWLFWEGASLSLSDVAGEVDRFAVGLAERGVTKGDRVAIVLGNRPETLFAWFAANRLGAIAMPLAPSLKPAELSALFALVRPRVVIAAEHRALIDEANVALGEASRVGLATPADLATAGRGAPRAKVEPDDVAVLLGTSGTTGAPKAVMQTHRTYALTAEAFPAWVGLAASDRVLLTLPLHHINAQAYGVMAALGAGATLAIGPKFSASRFWADAKRLGATQVNAVGAIVSILLNTAASAADRDHGVRLVYTALALAEEQHRGFEERFGASMTVGYGLSESTFGTVWPRGIPPRYGTMGRLRQHPRLGEINRARVVRDDGTDAKGNEPGELWLANPATMAGYFGAPGETAAALDGGWLHTGDIVRRDADGFFTFVSRRKDMLRRRGENVSAVEIERVLASHPSVLEAAVIGTPSALGEDDIVAFVAPRPGAVVDVDDLGAYVRTRLADFKVPGIIHVRDALPRTETARVAKHLLK